jgi:predicted O-linked N-acetylglucosamine transferase (SPINDLY family)
LGSLQIYLKKIEEAVANYERAIILNPDIDNLLGSLMHAKMYLCMWDDLTHELPDLIKKIDNAKKVSQPFPILSLIDDPNIHKKCAQIYSNKKYSRPDTFLKTPPYPDHKKIKIGYFSPDFSMHPVADLTAELYENHDREKFEIHAFSFGLDVVDKVTNRIRAGVDYFHDVRKMSDYDVVKLTRSLEIDIAIDLAGFTGHRRTEIFFMSAAPVQASYLGYNGTMSSDFIDYSIVDQIVVPKDRKHHYSEKIVYLPNSYMSNDSKVKISNKVFKRKDVGLPADGFVFCCFNNFYKINPITFTRWMKILSKVEGSVLWLSNATNTVINNLKKEAKKNGIDENRLIFSTFLELKEDHLSRIKLADLFLDTLPFNAHATASDALSAGVPVLTYTGNAFAGRVATSLLNSVNLPEMITTSEEEYISTAIDLAKNSEKLKIIKDKLINNLPTAPLFNNKLFTKHLEAAYLVMHDRNQKGLDLDDIEIDH